MPGSSTIDLAGQRLTLGRRLAALRIAAGYTQQTFAPLTHYGRSTIANVETGRQSVDRDFWKQCDKILRTEGVLTAAYDQINPRGTSTERASALADKPRSPQTDTVTFDELRSATLSLLHPGDPGGGSQIAGHSAAAIWAPPGRYFPGLGIDVQILPAIAHDRVLIEVPHGYGNNPFLHGPGRGLVLGQTTDGRVYGLDRRHASRRIRSAVTDARLPIPQAYQLDDLTGAVLWAVANLDEALLADDGLLAECEPDLAGYETLTRSSVSRDLAADLSAVGRMWLGSKFCAGHIGRHASTLHDVPTFWTRERRGEEASGWLLFTHKHEYLQATAARLGTTRAVRAFCIPRAEVDASPIPERILLLLSAALIESYGIDVAITDAPEYTATTGFVTDRRTAVMANWIEADGIWHVDVTNHRPTVRESTDAATYARNRSVIGGGDPFTRLHAMADYLGLDWRWLTERCRELAAYGVAGIAQPRSRHLSVAGVDRACGHLATARPSGGTR